MFLKAQSVIIALGYRGHVWPVVAYVAVWSHPAVPTQNPELRKQRGGSTPPSGTNLSKTYGLSMKCA